MEETKKTCKYCNCEFVSDDIFEPVVCPNCVSIKSIEEYVSEYSRNHEAKVWDNEIHEHNMVKRECDLGDGVALYSLAPHKSSYRVEKRTKRVQAVIDKISFARDYLYFQLSPIFEILDSIYIKKDCFWDQTGNLIRYVHNCCFQEAVLKLRELLMAGTCKYSIKRISNTLLSDSRYVFREQEIYERLEFIESGEVEEERFEPFDINAFVTLINEAIGSNELTINAMKDYRDNQFAHIDELKSEGSPKQMSYENLKRLFCLAKSIYDGFLFAVAPDKYTNIIVDSNIWFSHLNTISKAYQESIEKRKEKH